MDAPYLHPNLTILNQEREVRIAATRVKNRESVPLIRANLELPY